MDAAGALGEARQSSRFQSRATYLPSSWLRGICGLAGDEGHADGQRDQGEGGLHYDELLRSGKLENVIEKKLRFNEL